MATSRNDTKHGLPASDEGIPLTPEPAPGLGGGNSASEIIEAPQKPARDKLDPHDFADGGGSGGGEAFSRKKTKS